MLSFSVPPGRRPGHRRRRVANPPQRGSLRVSPRCSIRAYHASPTYFTRIFPAPHVSSSCLPRTSHVQAGLQPDCILLRVCNPRQPCFAPLSQGRCAAWTRTYLTVININIPNSRSLCYLFPFPRVADPATDGGGLQTHRNVGAYV